MDKRETVPAMVVSVSSPELAESLLNMNKATPADKQTAQPYSHIGYVLPDTIFPINMTGITLDALASTCVGKLTYLSASY